MTNLRALDAIYFDPRAVNVYVLSYGSRFSESALFMRFLYWAFSRGEGAPPRGLRELILRGVRVVRGRGGILYIYNIYINI